jgi:hypothetical protein
MTHAAPSAAASAPLQKAPGAAAHGAQLAFDEAPTVGEKKPGLHAQTHLFAPAEEDIRPAGHCAQVFRGEVRGGAAHVPGAGAPKAPSIHVSCKEKLPGLHGEHARPDVRAVPAGH